MLELKVKDTGPGMPSEVLKRVGTPFFTTREAGTGLGVAQCQRLVGSSGGRMAIESEVVVGTTVTITLPTAAWSEKAPSSARRALLLALDLDGTCCPADHTVEPRDVAAIA